MTEYTYGLKITSGNKTKGCVLFKLDYERGKIINNSTLFMGEIENFCDSKGTGTYASSFGHDDVVMAQMQIVFAKQTLQFKNLLDDFTSGVSVAVDDKHWNPYDVSDVMQDQHTTQTQMIQVAGWMDTYEIMRTLQQNNLSRLNGLH